MVRIHNKLPIHRNIIALLVLLFPETPANKAYIYRYPTIPFRAVIEQPMLCSGLQ